jgi:hypothetical protein
VIRNIGCFHLESARNLRPLDILEKDINAELAKNGESCLAGSIIVLPEAFNLIGRYETGESYDAEPSSGLKRRFTQLAHQLDAIFVVGLVDNDEDNARVPPFSASYLITPACCARLSRKTGRDDMAKGTSGAATLYQASPQPEDPPFLYAGETWIGSLLCMDTEPYSGQPNQEQVDNHDRHSRLKAQILDDRGATLPVLCVPARMRAMTTKDIENHWGEMHYILANACDPNDSCGHPSILRVHGRESRSVTEGLVLQPIALAG